MRTDDDNARDVGLDDARDLLRAAGALEHDTILGTEACGEQLE